MFQARRIALLLALLAPMCAALAGRSLLLDTPLPPGDRTVARTTALHAAAADTIDGVAGRLGLACAASEVFVWHDDDLTEIAARLESASFAAGALYREIYRDFDTVVFRVIVAGGERLGMWVRLDGVALLAVCAI